MKLKCVAVSEKSAYIVYFDSQEKMEVVIRAWNALVKDVTDSNVALFIKTYRELLGVPVEATIDEEMNFINEKYGNIAANNKEFMTQMRKARGLYEEQRNHYPVFPDWVDENFGCECEKVFGVFNFQEAE